MQITKPQRIFAVLFVTPLYFVLGIVSGLIGTLILGYFSTHIGILREFLLAWDQAVPSWLDPWTIASVISAYLVISAIDFLLKQTKRSDRIALSILAGITWWVIAAIWGV